MRILYGACVVLAIVTLAPPAFGQQAAPRSPAPRCDQPESRQFDFWVGHWAVVNTKDGTPAGQSVIEKLYGGCAIRENWSEPELTGGSLNAWVSADRRWHQTWTDSSGTWREFVGGFAEGKMVLTWSHPSARMPGKTAQERMTFTPNSDGSVRQYMDQTIDGAKWVEGYDYTYKPVRGNGTSLRR